MSTGTIIKKQFIKTKLCPFQTKGFCLNGQNCTYAHSEKELRPLPDLRRTKFCDYLKRGSVCLRPSCPFAHAMEDLKPSTDLVTFKTSICFFWRKGKCFNGTKCRFAHGTAELRNGDCNEKSVYGMSNSQTNESISDLCAHGSDVEVLSNGNQRGFLMTLYSHRRQRNPSCANEGETGLKNVRAFSNFRPDWLSQSSECQLEPMLRTSSCNLSVCHGTRATRNTSTCKTGNSQVLPSPGPCPEPFLQSDVAQSPTSLSRASVTVTFTPSVNETPCIDNGCDDAKLLDTANHDAINKQLVQTLQAVVDQLKGNTNQQSSASASSLFNDAMLMSGSASFNDLYSGENRLIVNKVNESSQHVSREEMVNNSQHEIRNLCTPNNNPSCQQQTYQSDFECNTDMFKHDLAALLSQLPNFPQMDYTVGYPVLTDIPSELPFNNDSAELLSKLMMYQTANDNSKQPIQTLADWNPLL